MTTPKTTRMTTPISRRRLLERTAAGLTFAFTIAADPLELAAGAAAAQTPYAPNLWLTIGTDGIITIVSPAAELGQGSFTTLPLILAEELDADWSKVRMTYPPVWDGKKYGNPEYGEAFATTSSFAVWGYYRNMRLAGAQARRVLLDAVAERWAVPVAELGTEPSVVVHKASGRRIGYGEIAAFAQIPDELRNRPLRDPKNAPIVKDLKEPQDFRLIGHDVPRVDVPLKVTGAAIFGIDVQVPGMVYAAVLQSPYYGGAPVTVDDAAARRIPGVTDVVHAARRRRRDRRDASRPPRPPRSCSRSPGARPRARSTTASARSRSSPRSRATRAAPASSIRRSARRRSRCAAPPR